MQRRTKSEKEALSINIINTIKNNGSFEKPVSGKSLETRFGISRRVLENIVERLLVKDGHPIIGKNMEDGKGYFIPKNNEERDIAIRTYKNQVKTMKRNLEIKMSIDLSEYWEEELENAE